MTTATCFMYLDSARLLALAATPYPLIEGQVPINSADQLRMIVLAATDDSAFDLRSLAFGEVVRTQDDPRPLVD